MLGVKPRVLKRWADRGQVPCIMTGREERRFRRSDIEGWAGGLAGDREPRRPRPTEGSGGASLPLP